MSELMSSNRLSTPSMGAISSSEPTPRLSPIDRYAGFWLALLKAAFRIMFGKVMLPLRVLIPRIPGYAFPHFCLMLYGTIGLQLPRTLQHVLSMRVSRNNGCHFCFDLHKATFMLEKPDGATLDLATSDLADPALDPQARAVLAYADEVVHQGNVSDETFAGLVAVLPERQVAEVVWLAALVIYTNMLARPLGLPSEGFCAIAQAKAAKQSV
ncbi:MAG TPA: carboxymuconolactone decarboxylase family protein [Polyangiales bacterium]|nr:carboxymuconolactone decarboxylase family protein [Polyangiales bacterium]